jgi:hypothetical protein
MAIARQRSPGAADEAESILGKAGFRRPTPLQQKTIPLILAGRDVLVEAASGAGKTLAILTPVLLGLPARVSGIRAVLLVQGKEALKRAQRQWKNLVRACSSPLTHAVIGADDGTRKEAALLAQKPGFLIASPERLIDHIRQGSVDLGALTFLAVDAPPQAPEFLRDIEFILSKCPPERRTAFFVPELDDSTLELLGGIRQQVVLRVADWQAVEAPEPEEQVEREREVKPPRLRPGAADRRKNVPHDATEEARGAARGGAGTAEQRRIDDEALKALIKSYLERITQLEDAGEINRLKRIYRRNVPLHLRGYLAAYLLRELATHGGAKAAAKGKTPSVAKAPSARRAPGGKAPSGKYARLFINAGRNRRVFPNDIYELFSSELGVPRSDLGEVRVLDNYSFVEVQTRHAENAIAGLAGKELKGRKLAVDYARPREEKPRE